MSNKNSISNIFPVGGSDEEIKVIAYYTSEGFTMKKEFIEKVRVYLCGCTDNEALNRNPLAEIDDGSCVYGGKVTFYKDPTSRGGGGSHTCKSQEEVYISLKHQNSLLTGKLSGIAESPHCDGPNTLSFKLYPGSYSFGAESGSCKKGFQFVVETGECTLVGIKF